MSMPRSLPPADPEPTLVASFEQPELRIPKAVRRQAEFFLFFARTVFPLLEHYRERLATVYTPDNGRPAWDPVRLLGVLVMQFVTRMPDRQAAEAVQYDNRWRLALHLRPEDVAFDPSLLVVFRNRLVGGGQESLAFEAVLNYLVEHGWIPRRSRQRLDATHVWGVVSVMSRLEIMRETVRLLLEDVEADGALPSAWAAYWDIYVERKLDHRLEEAAIQKKLAQTGHDMLAIWQDAATCHDIIMRDTFVLFQRVFLEQFEIHAQLNLLKRPSPPSGCVSNPHEPEAQWSTKSSTKDKSWIGYKQQVAETVQEEPRQPGEPTASFLTAMATQDAIESDDAGLIQVLHEQAGMGLGNPSTLYVDGGYICSEALKNAQEAGWELQGPAPAAPTRGGMLTVESFTVNVEERYAICPASHRSSNCSHVTEKYKGSPYVFYRIEWTDAVCKACTLFTHCVSAQYGHRTLVVNPYHSFLQARRIQMKTEAFKLDMHRRNAIEGTQSELVRAFGLRRARYRGKVKARLQAYLIGTACNIRRLFRRLEWLADQACTTSETAMITG